MSFFWNKRPESPDEIADAFAGVNVDRDDPEKRVLLTERRLIALQIVGGIFVGFSAAAFALRPGSMLLGRVWNVVTLTMLAYAVGFNGGTLYMGRKWRRNREAQRAVERLNLKPAELAHINMNHTCPDCGVGGLLHGPHGGCSINVKCNNGECRHEFSIAFVGRSAMMGERLQRDDPTVYREELLWK